MTPAEAMAIKDIVATAHGECEDCVNELISQLNIVFPRFRWSMVKPWRGNYTVSVEEVQP